MCLLATTVAFAYILWVPGFLTCSPPLLQARSIAAQVATILVATITGPANDKDLAAKNTINAEVGRKNFRQNTKISSTKRPRLDDIVYAEIYDR